MLSILECPKDWLHLVKTWRIMFLLEHLLYNVFEEDAEQTAFGFLN